MIKKMRPGTLAIVAVFVVASDSRWTARNSSTQVSGFCFQPVLFSRRDCSSHPSTAISLNLASAGSSNEIKADASAYMAALAGGNKAKESQAANQDPFAAYYANMNKNKAEETSALHYKNNIINNQNASPTASASFAADARQEAGKVEQQQRMTTEESERAKEAKAEEQKRLAEEARIVEEQRLVAAAEEAARLAEEQRMAEEARMLAEEEARIFEKAEQQRLAAEAEQQRLEQEAWEAEQQQRLAQAAEQQRLGQEAWKAEEARIAEKERLAQEARSAKEMRLEEEARLAEERQLAEEARLAEEQSLKNEVRIADEQRLETARLAGEQQLAEEAARLMAKEAEARLAKEQRIAAEARRAAFEAAEVARVAQEQERLEKERIMAEQEAAAAEQQWLAVKARADEAARLAKEHKRTMAIQKQAAQSARLEPEKIMTGDRPRYGSPPITEEASTPASLPMIPIGSVRQITSTFMSAKQDPVSSRATTDSRQYKTAGPFPFKVPSRVAVLDLQPVPPTETSNFGPQASIDAFKGTEFQSSQAAAFHNQVSQNTKTIVQGGSPYKPRVPQVQTVQFSPFLYQETRGGRTSQFESPAVKPPKHQIPQIRQHVKFSPFTDRDGYGIQITPSRAPTVGGALPQETEQSSSPTDSAMKESSSRLLDSFSSTVGSSDRKKVLNLSDKARNMTEQFDAITIQGDSIKTWSFKTHMIDRVHVMMNTEGRPINALLELWQGPDNKPQIIGMYSENGKTRPFNAIIETPLGHNSLCVRNTGPLAFPLAAYVEPELSLEIPQGSNELLGITQLLAGSSEPEIIQGGGSVRSFSFGPDVESVQIFLETDGRPLEARMELLQGPNNDKQVIELYTQDGRTRPFFGIFETPGYHSVIRVVNTAQSLAYPITVRVEPYVVNDGTLHDISEKFKVL